MILDRCQECAINVKMFFFSVIIERVRELYFGIVDVSYWINHG